MKIVNILISTYNGETYIEEQLRSIFDQTYKTIRVYVRDDGSTDRTLQILEKWEKENKIVLFTSDNIGFCGSFFELLCKACEGDYWAFCDQDDVWMPDKIKNAVDWMEKNDSESIPVLYHCSFEYFSDLKKTRKNRKLLNYKYDFQKSLTSTVYYGFCMVINKKLREMLLKCDYTKAQSHDWFAAIITECFGKSYYSPIVDARHRIHNKNTSIFSFWDKICLGIKLFRQDNFYLKNAQEIYRVFSKDLNKENEKVLFLFINGDNKITLRLKKAFYMKRWNSSFAVDIGLRILMMFGKV